MITRTPLDNRAHLEQIDQQAKNLAAGIDPSHLKQLHEALVIALVDPLHINIDHTSFTPTTEDMCRLIAGGIRHLLWQECERVQNMKQANANIRQYLSHLLQQNNAAVLRQLKHQTADTALYVKEEIAA